MYFKFEQPEKVAYSIDVIPSGMVIASSDEQSENDEYPSFSRLFDKITDFKLSQELKAKGSISLTLLGIDMEIRLLQLLKAYDFIITMLSGNFIDSRFVQPLYLQLIVYQRFLVKTVEK